LSFVGISDWKQGLLWGGLAGGLFIVLNSFNGIFQIGFPVLPQSIAVVSKLLTVGLLAPVLEEGFFRGVLLGVLRNRSLWFAVLVNSLLFSLFHLAVYGGFLTSIGAFVGAFVFGLLASWMVVKTNNLLSAIVMHGIVNLYLARNLLVIV